MTSSESESRTIKKIDRIPRRVSLVWKYFDKLNSSRIRCRICYHEQNYQCTTGNILRHLKNKHQLDATIKGLQDIRNIQRMKDLDEMCINKNNLIASSTKKDRVTKRSLRKRHYISSENIKLDQYDFKEPVNVACTDSLGEMNEISAKNSYQLSFYNISKNLKDDRVVAETEYFREKAAYFRMQRFLASLQAKKMKLELDELYAKHNKKKS